jgi:uncharacterized membrane protein YhiD involved in acid resistance
LTLPWDTVRSRFLSLAFLTTLCMALTTTWPSARLDAAQQGPPAEPQQGQPDAATTSLGSVDSSPAAWQDMAYEGMIRLPLAGGLGALLAFRPKRRGTPTRTPAVVQTQIILTIVGALIMLVVGSSLARAFGIVGAASLIRYRSKIEDPKDAGVMLCCLSVGLATGVGVYGLAVWATVFLVGALAVVESFEPKGVTNFELQLTGLHDAGGLRPRVEQVLARYRIEHSLRSQSDEALSYDVHVPLETETDRVTNAILKLDTTAGTTVEWEEKKVKKS